MKDIKLNSHDIHIRTYKFDANRRVRNCPMIFLYQKILRHSMETKFDIYICKGVSRIFARGGANFGKNIFQISLIVGLFVSPE